jgi:predicted dehydrogenase
MKRFAKASDIKVGVVGYGGAFDMGKGHLNQAKAAGMTPFAVTDVDPSRLKAAREDFPGIETYPSLDAMLKKSAVNLIVVITPHNTHAPLALKALKAGRHVVSEKPLAITTAECDAMIAAAKKSGVVLSTYHNRHWDAHVLAAVKHIREGAIGEVIRFETRMAMYAKPRDWWRTSKTISGGVLHDWGVHLLEYGLQVIDSEIVEVSGFAHRGFWAPQTKWKKDTIEDDGFAAVRFKSGACLTLLVSSIETNPRRGIFNVTGTKGSYVADWRFNEIIRPEGDTVVTTKILNPPAQTEKFYQNIADHLVKGAKLVITPEWSRRPIHILDLANRSAEQGRSLPAKYT